LNVALAVVRIAAALTLYASGSTAAALATRPIPPWVLAALSATFAVMALVLVLGHQKDPRAAWLGGTLALVGCPLAVPLVSSHTGSLGWLIHVRPDAFLGAFVWEFVACFPMPLQGRRARIAKGIVAGGVFVGMYLAGASLLAIWFDTPALGPLLAVSRNPIVFYWPLLLAISVPAFFALLWRGHVAEGAARRRVQVFVTAVFVGLAPIALDVFVEGVWRAYELFVHRPTIEPWVGAVMFAALGSLPLTTAYSVLFDRVVSVRIVLHKALQHALARYTILALTLIPFGGLLLFLGSHRDESLVALLTGDGRPMVLGGLAIAGVLAWQVRRPLLAALDRRYFREPFDASRILERLVGQSAPDAGELGGRLSAEVGGALHAKVHVLLVDETRNVLRDTDGRLQPLSAMTPLLNLADRADQLLDVGARDSRAAIDALPEHERKWLAAGQVSVIAAIRSHERPVGLIALTPKMSELPYTDADRRFVATVASAAGLAVDRLHRRAPAVAAPSELAGRECERCFSVYASEARRCLCGAPLVEAPVPHVLRGVFRFEQRIAAGSVGVVYRAVDLALGRNVAIKTLPDVTGERMAALVQEARAMARVTHGNLAAVHGVETWRDVSFLVQEYLEKGTLAHRLYSARLDVSEAIDLGIILADLLEHLHRYDLIHCDIKPTNIGYTAEGIVKLFDFGLARRVETDDAASTGSRTFAGTPFYMSPEAIRGERPSAGFDLWALSVVLYEAIAGRRPFDGATTSDVLATILRGAPERVSAIAPELPDAVSTFFEVALHRDRATRPSTAGELGRALSELRRSLGQHPAQTSSVARAAAV
jgi:signal transduction histidine kinase